MNIRDKVQQKAVDSYKGNAILALAPRTGKTKCAIDIFKRDDRNKILIAYPTLDIKQSWINDFSKWDWEGNVTFTTFESLKKYVDEKYDLVVYDEIHAFSKQELSVARKIGKNNEVLGLSGTMTRKTKDEIWDALRIEPCFTYTIDEAVEDGILADYKITVEMVPFDNIDKHYKAGIRTEKQQYKALEWWYNKTIEENKSTFTVDLKIQSFLQNCQSKIKRTKQIIKENLENRLLVFCGNTAVTDQLGIPVYHSKQKDEQLFKDFCSGIGNHLAVVRMGSVGVTILPIQLGLLNYTSGNPEDTGQKISRFLGSEWDNPDKKAHIIILCSDCKYQKERIKTSLRFFDDNKIKWK